MFLLIIFAIILADQGTKILLFEQAVLNSGIAFGAFNSKPALILGLIGAGILGVMVLQITHRDQNKTSRLGYSFILAGLMSNLVDRVRVGAVIDPFTLGDWLPFFNLADLAILTGLGILTLIHFRKRSV
ncbi:signal peptidase II [Candidatus Berkelbacteria bacterium]|nr:signal peptidase II [Candidatus Berkelbacteria bacterium]